MEGINTTEQPTRDLEKKMGKREMSGMETSNPPPLSRLGSPNNVSSTLDIVHNSVTLRISTHTLEHFTWPWPLGGPFSCTRDHQWVRHQSIHNPRRCQDFAVIEGAHMAF